MKTYAYGFPRLGLNREYKKTIESFWKGDLAESETRKALDKLQKDILNSYKNTVEVFPVGEMTGYDHMLDTAIMVGLYKPKNLEEYYELCRGKRALEMTKWFNTNYHYLVPDLGGLGDIEFIPNWNKAKEYLDRFKEGIPYFIGPFTFLKLCKGISSEKFEEYLLSLVAVYREFLSEIPEAHFDEPAFVMDLSAEEINLIKKAYETFQDVASKIHLFTYYGNVDFLTELYELPVASIGLDFVHGRENLQAIKANGFPMDKTLIAGIVDGRNVWKNDFNASIALLRDLSEKVHSLGISNAAPLYHLPITTEEEQLDTALMEALAFATEKLAEIRDIAKLFDSGTAIPTGKPKDFGHNMDVQKKIQALTEKDFEKGASVEERRKLHDEILRLPLFPTTTIGSYPQTQDVRKTRADFRKGKISEEEYTAFIKKKIDELIAFQEKIGLDVLVHGEFERTDMVEFFAEKLGGVATTKNGWIISYGTRGYRPPIIFGDVSRPAPMTIKEIQYAQSLTDKPVKGMLTGAVTIIAWSFVREDIPIQEVAYQIGLALREEIQDYEKAGIKIVQVDEPAIREKAPIKKRDWPAYFEWAIKSFRLTTNTDPKTQIHTHMCYSEFGEIVEQIDQMDFDVISIETTRSRGDIIESFERIDFKKQIGLGVWDIHSPVVPTEQEMREVVERALKVIPKENFWINPDCGLKTRQWEETEASLKNLVALAQDLRKEK